MTNAALTRRNLILYSFAGAFVPGTVRAADETIYVAKSPSCGCCGAWIDHMRQAGFEVEVQNLEYDALQRLKARLGVAPKHASCHTAQVAGYVVEGHVPAADVTRLLREHPNGLGLSVPGMPVGSPGMEMGDQRDPYDVVLMKDQSRDEIFQSYR